MTNTTSNTTPCADIRQVFATSDGRNFHTRHEAEAHARELLVEELLAPMAHRVSLDLSVFALQVRGDDFREHRLKGVPQDALVAGLITFLVQTNPEAFRQALEILHPSNEVQA
jgi:hypothetical protein